MGQTQSESYECAPEDSDERADSPQYHRKADTSLAGLPAKKTSPPTAKGTAKRTTTNGGNNHKPSLKPQRRDIARGDNNQTNAMRFKKNPTAAAAAAAAASADRMTPLEQQQRHVRKLSNVSNRNIQLLSIKPRSEKDTYAEGLRSRRRSSLINLILGAPSCGPRFSEDLCSLSSHMSELCNFGIDYFPDTIQSQTSFYNNGRPNFPSIGSSLSKLEDGFVNLQAGSAKAAAATLDQQQRTHVLPPCEAGRTDFVRRRSSLGSLSSFEAGRGNRSYFNPDTNRHNPFAGAADFSSHQCIEPSKMEDQIGDCQAQEGAAVRGLQGDCGDQPLGGDSAMLLASPSQRQYQLVGHQRVPGRSFVSSSSFLASVDLTSSLDGGDDSNGQRSAIAASGRPSPPDDNRGINVDRNGEYYFDRQVGVATKRKGRARVPGESGPDSGCSQDSASLSSSPSLLLSSAASNLRASSGPVMESAATSGDGCLMLVSDKGAQTTTAAANGGAFVARGRINHAARRMIHRSGSELSLYSTTSGSLSHNQLYYQHAYPRHISRGSIGSVMLEAGSIRREPPARATADSDEQNPYVPSLHQHVNDRASAKVPAPTTTATTTTGSNSHLRETKLIIMLQVCLPFILAGFGNMGAGLVLNQIAHWEAFRNVPIFFVLLPSFVGLKGNIEMTLASRLSTLSNLNLLDTSYQRRHAFLTNLILILSQAIGLSIFAAIASVACEFGMGKLDDANASNILNITILVVLPSALVTSVTLVIISSIVMWFAIWLAKQLQVNPDNLSTLMAALYGDVSCVLTYGLFAQSIYSLNQQGAMAWPISIISLALIAWPLLWYAAYQSRETHELALSSMPPMLAAIMVSLGSGAILSLVVDRFRRVALYQPVVNGFGANLIAVQASRVSTWLWCTALRKQLSSAGPKASPPAKGKGELGFEFEPSNKMPYGSLASFVDLPGARTASLMSKQTAEPKQNGVGVATATISLMTKLSNLPASLVKLTRILLWSFCNSSPNAVAARLLLVMLIPAHTLYFIVIWLVAPAQYIVLTGPFYLVYITLCVVQVFVLLSICQPLMTLLMRKHLDPDIFGISLLMALADLIGTVCLTGAFFLLADLGDPNAL